MSNKTNQPATVTISYCKTCGNIVRASVTHLMTAKSIAAFNRQVEELDLTVKHKPILEYKNSSTPNCTC